MHICDTNHVPNYVAVCKLLLCIPVTSVECERTFSMQNRIKNKLCNRLGEERVDVLIKISLGPATEVFDFRTAVQHWKAAKQRR